MNPEGRTSKPGFSGAHPLRTPALFLAVCLAGGFGAAQVPGILSHQGKLMVGGTNFAGNAQFKFALVSESGDTTWWSHDGTSAGGGEPSGSPVSLLVTQGVFAVNLGDTNVATMTQPIPSGVFTHDSVWLRVWVNDGVNGWQRLVPDRRVTAAGYALVAGHALAPASSATNFSGALAGDVTGSQGATVVSRVSGVSAANVAAGAIAANAATDLNAPGAIVRRDGCDGNFSAGTITARFIGDGSGLTNLPTSPSQYGAPAGAVLASVVAHDPTLLAAGYRQIMSFAAPAWVNGATANAPAARVGHTAVWDGQRMMVWGGTVGANAYTASGGMYDANADAWTTLSTLGAPSGRSGHTAVWTGSAMIVWGGQGPSGYLRSGGRFTPGTQTWSPVPASGAPSERTGHVAVWTGQQMLVWGGLNPAGLLEDGALYDPSLNQWTALTVPDPPAARLGAAAVWAGDRMIVWGGQGEAGELDTGGQLLFTNGVPIRWVALPLADAPWPRSGHSAVWAGDRMIVWGGQSGGVALGDGAAYCPGCDQWKPVAAANAPVPRTDHAAVWTGTELLILDGTNAAGDLASGAAYDPVTQEWGALSGVGGPLERTSPVAVWTGTEVLVFGGTSGGQRVASLQRLSPQPAWHFYRKL